MEFYKPIDYSNIYFYINEIVYFYNSSTGILRSSYSLQLFKSFIDDKSMQRYNPGSQVLKQIHNELLKLL